MSASRILVVEDDAEIAEFLSLGLAGEGYEVFVQPQGAGLFERLAGGDVSIVILDRMLPDAEGADLCRRLREAGDGVMVLMLTARDALEDKLEGLRAGADDYVTKPFAFEELLARIEVLLRRGSAAMPSAPTLHYADLAIDPARKTASRAGIDLDLTTTEFKLLQFFVEQAEQVVSRRTILNAVWGYDFDPNTNIVEVYVSYLRRKMEANSGTRLLRNVRGFGYVLSETYDRDANPAPGRHG